MTTVYKCDKCGKVFDSYEECQKHESSHFEVKTWMDSEDEKVFNRNVEYDPCLWAPSAVVVPMTRTVYDDDTGKWNNETVYIKYFYSAKMPAEQVFPVDESIMK